MSTAVGEVIPESNLTLQTNSVEVNKDILTNDKLSYYYTELLCANFFTFLLRIKMIHWQTESYAIHKTTDDLYNRFNELLDELVETLQGEILSSTNNLIGKVVIRDDCNINIKDQLNSSKPDAFLDLLNKVRNFLSNVFENKLKEILPQSNLSSILNIRDEMLGEIQKAVYLVTFK